MKNYRKVVPLLLIGFAILAIYSRVTELQDKERQYYSYLEQARSYREGKIYTDAFEQYQNALNMKNTLAVCEEVGEMFLEAEDKQHIRSWGEYMVEVYPKEVNGYEYLVNYHLSQARYEECFEIYDTVKKRGLYSQSLTETMNDIRYVYELNGGRYTYVSEYSCSYCYAANAEGTQYGYCNVEGKEIIKPQYLQAGAFGNEYAAVQDNTGEFYFIDTNGNRKLNVPKDITITKVGFLSSDRYPVGTEGKMYYADTQGNLVLGPYEDATAYNGQVAAVKESDFWYLIDLEGKKVSDAYLGFAMDVKEIIFRNNVVFAKTEQGYVCLNGQCERINDVFYEDAKCFLDTTYTAVKIDGKWGYIDNTGKICIEPQYEDAKPFTNGLAAVKTKGFWGYIDMEGNIVIEPVFQDANCMNENGCTFVVTEDNKWKVLRLIGGVSYERNDIE